MTPKNKLSVELKRLLLKFALAKSPLTIIVYSPSLEETSSFVSYFTELASTKEGLLERDIFIASPLSSTLFPLLQNKKTNVVALTSGLLAETLIDQLFTYTVEIKKKTELDAVKLISDGIDLIIEVSKDETNALEVKSIHEVMDSLDSLPFSTVKLHKLYQRELLASIENNERFFPMSKALRDKL